MPPEDIRRTVAHAQDHEPCTDCGAQPGQPCERPGPGRSVHRARFIAAAIAVSQQAKAARRTSEQAAILASLPKVSRADIEACRTPKGGYSFTRAWFLEHGLPYPPIPGWRQAAGGEKE
jgi:hypothetical protein